MNTFHPLKTVGALLIIATGVSLLTFGVAVVAQDRSNVREISLKANTLPYKGFGTVSILDDGVILIELGGQEQTRYDGDEEVFSLTPSDILAYRIDVSGLSIVQSGKEVFLDRNGVQLNARGLKPTQVYRLMFPDPTAIDPNAARDSVLSFTGDLEIAFTQRSGGLSLRTVDSEATGRVFSLMARVVTSTVLEEPGAGDGITLLRFTSPIASGGNSNCDINCTQGTSTIACTNSGCQCFCDSGKPKCRCLDIN